MSDPDDEWRAFISGRQDMEEHNRDIAEEGRRFAELLRRMPKNATRITLIYNDAAVAGFKAAMESAGFWGMTAMEQARWILECGQQPDPLDPLNWR